MTFAASHFNLFAYGLTDSFYYLFGLLLIYFPRDHRHHYLNDDSGDTVVVRSHQPICPHFCRPSDKQLLLQTTHAITQWPITERFPVLRCHFQ